MTIVLFLIILAALIFVHELGHFMAAKLFGIRVDEFAIGFPPEIISKKVGETKYALNLIPFGGYVKIFGENPDEESLRGADSKRSFVNAVWWKQIIVLLSGIFMNIVFAWVLISISFNVGFLTGIEDQYKDHAQDVSITVLSVVKDSPSDIAGIQEGDRIISIESDKIVKISPTISEIQNIIAESKGTLKVVYERGSATSSTDITAVKDATGSRKAIGVSMALVGTVKFPPLQSFYEGLKLILIEVKGVTIGIYTFIFSLLKGESTSLREVSGPVGIVSMVGQARGLGLSYLLGLIATISINLAVLNAVPFPALDGGRAMFACVEVIIRRKIKPVILNWANTIGFVILISLMLFVTYKDILKLIK